MKWNKLVKESNTFGGEIKISGEFSIFADTVEEALDKICEQLNNAYDNISRNKSKLIKKYKYWNQENEGDVQFGIHYDKDSNASAFVEIENVR